ncbi:FUSC family protein [bacterium SCSIO 12643]|nr:FUSC family protein [bacterium SCSIO 12643]
MSQKKLTELSDEELLQEAQKMKPTGIYDALIIGLLIGVSLYSIYKNGLGLLTLLPLVYIPIATKNKLKVKEINDLLKERNLI